MQKRRRESRYPAIVGVRVSNDIRQRLEALADQERTALGIIVRRALAAGLPLIENGEAGAEQSAMDQARNWWQGLGNRQRNDWQRRVAPLTGRQMIAEAWKQANGL